MFFGRDYTIILLHGFRLSGRGLNTVGCSGVGLQLTANGVRVWDIACQGLWAGLRASVCKAWNLELPRLENSWTDPSRVFVGKSREASAVCWNVPCSSIL